MALHWMALDEWKRKIAKGVRPLDVGVRKAAMPEVEVLDDGARTVKFVLSDDTVDRDKDTVSVKGWDLDNFRKNPIFVWAHDYSQPPIGRALSIGVEGTKLVAVAEFQPKDLNPFADTIYRMLKGGWIKGSSVGFKPKEFDYNSERKGVDFRAQELLEVSVVPIPSHPGALAEAKAAGSDVVHVRAWAVKTLLELHPTTKAMTLTDATTPGAEHAQGQADPTRDTEGCELAGLCPKRVNQGCPMAEGCPMGKAVVGAVGKVGRVLSAKNEAALQAAAVALEAVLAQVRTAVADVAAPIEPEPVDAMKALVDEMLTKLIREDDGKFLVTSESGKVLGTHATRAEAEAQLRAIEANKHRALADALTKDEGVLELADADDTLDLGDLTPEDIAGVVKAATHGVARSWLKDRANLAAGRVD